MRVKHAITIAAPIIGAAEIKGVNQVLNSGLLAQGVHVAALEEAFATYCGTKYAVAVNSGTAALHAALFAAGVGPGDEVITTPFSFIATINPILLLGAWPVLVDIDPVTFNLNATAVERAVSRRTKAIIPVHLYGQPAENDEIRATAQRYKLTIIEDACQAVGATYRNKKAGNLGDMGCFSLYATKNIMSGEGGVVTTNNKHYADSMRRFRQHGMSGPYEYDGIGLNYRMSDLHAAIAEAQLKQVDRFNAARQKNASRLTAGLSGIDGLELPQTAAKRSHVFHQYTIRVLPNFRLSRDKLAAKLHDAGIGAAVYYPKALTAYPHIAALGYKPGDFPEAERAAAEVLSLPVHPKVSGDDVKTIIAVVRELADA